MTGAMRNVDFSSCRIELANSQETTGSEWDVCQYQEPLLSVTLFSSSEESSTLWQG